ncbi:superoxide dismutase [Ferruginibacter paludis]|uniref:superoxide dismutase n=1 Tax=Ferruginibacter paludis TaxID=1310417 RepID=UPI0025B2D83A|nr:superoxide dismutase [Ferruginibacter paludis]MDN3654706.1 superoxide dismutase [Ferruginibacter paludis]
MKQSSRRNFIAQSALAGIGALVTLPSLAARADAENKLSAIPSSPLKTGFDQQPLPYAYNTLEPLIDTMTMDIHYNKHAATYSKNVKEAAQAEGVDTTKPLEDVLNKISKYTVKMRNNAGGHYNHEMFWKLLSADPNTQPDAKLLAAINTSFGSMDEMKKQFTTAATSRFGSGWAWLIFTADKKLAIISTPNQDNPLMDIAETKGFPVMGLDVWEHAYYLKYQNRRADYIASFWKLLNWKTVSERFNSI